MDIPEKQFNQSKLISYDRNYHSITSFE